MRFFILIVSLLLGEISFSQTSPQWTQHAHLTSFGRHRGIGVGIGNRAYLGTGHLNGTGIEQVFSDWWEYDPGTDTWTQKSDYPGNFGQGDENVVAIGFETKGYVGLGQIDPINFYRFEPQTNTWTQVQSPPIGSFHHTHAFSIGNKGYFPGLFSTIFMEFDSDLETWTQKANLPFSTSYGVPTFSVGDKGYIKNGASFWEYDPAVDQWTSKEPFPGLFPHRPKGVGNDSYGYFIGGFAGNPSQLPWDWANEVWRYDPALDSWERMDDFTGSTRRWAVTARVGERIYYGLGTDGTNFNDFWEFNYNAASGLDEIGQHSFTTYPTLATDYVNFTSDDINDFSVEVFDGQGKSVAVINAMNGMAKLERLNLKYGTYIYHIQIEQKTVHSGRFIFN